MRIWRLGKLGGGAYLCVVLESERKEIGCYDCAVPLEPMG